MDNESILPPYTLEERSRELLMRSKMLRWRARKACTRSWRLRNESEALLVILKWMRLTQIAAGLVRHPLLPIYAS